MRQLQINGKDRANRKSNNRKCGFRTNGCQTGKSLLHLYPIPRICLQDTINTNLFLPYQQHRLHTPLNPMEFSLSTFYNVFDTEKTPDFDVLDAERRLESFTAAVALTPELVLHNLELFDEVVEMAHAFPALASSHRKQLTYLVCLALAAVSGQCKNAIENCEYADLAAALKLQLERYGYLVFVVLSHLAKEDFPVSAQRQRQNSDKWRSNSTQVEEVLTALVAVLRVPLARVFVTTPERKLFLDMFVRTVFHLVEVPDRMKNATTRTLMFRVVAGAVVDHQLGATVQSCVVQALTYYVHLPPYMAELLHVLDSKHDHSQLAEELLHELSSMEFNTNDANGPKAVSEFLVRLLELSPRLVLKQMSTTAQLLDNSNYTLRCSVVETCGNIVTDILRAKEEDHAQNTSAQVDGLLGLLQDRFLDKNPYVRTKAIQAMVKVFSLSARMPQRRHAVMLLAVRSLQDRTTLVRRNAMKLMYKLLLAHPFSAAHGSQLVEAVWQRRLDDVNAEIDGYVATMQHGGGAGGESGAVSLESEDESGSQSGESGDERDNGAAADSPVGPDSPAMDVDPEADLTQQASEKALLVKARLTQQYHIDALSFIRAAQKGAEVASRLLFSKNRNEVLESMDYLVLADTHGIANAAAGIRKMLHLVWMKGQSDEGKSISAHLMDCYKDLFLTAPANATMAQSAALVARNLIGLTIDASVADLVSLEKLLCMMYDAHLINVEMLKALWQIYSRAGDDRSDASPLLMHGAIIVFYMLLLANRSIVHMGVDALLRVGLGAVGQSDMVLCKHTCAALLKIVPTGPAPPGAHRFGQQEDAVRSLREVLLSRSESAEWYGAAEQCIAALFRLAPRPEETFSEILSAKAVQVFKNTPAGREQMIGLLQLLFTVGHVAVKCIEYLEQLETQFKKKKHDGEKKKKEPDDNELEMIGGTSEDDFTDAVVYIKERELLYGENAILARFGPMVQAICADSAAYSNTTLQRSAVLCLAKLMCVSSKFCEENLALLINIMEKSPDPVIRCNCVLGLGDMAVCFNNLVDENTDFLYRRLTDENIMVQRTCLMTVTFLILAGQVKVKGQLSAMAKCLENGDQGISDMCRLFFTELATKDNAIYNGFIDIFSGLSNDETLADDARKRIIKFLVGFIEKEKHQKQLSEKLLVRLMKMQSEREWNDVAFVLTTIPYKSDAITQALEMGYTMVSARE